MTAFSLRARLHLGANSSLALSLPQSSPQKLKGLTAPSSEGAEAATAASHRFSFAVEIRCKRYHWSPIQPLSHRWFLIKGIKALVCPFAVLRSRFGFAILAFADGGSRNSSLHPPLEALGISTLTQGSRERAQLTKVQAAVKPTGGGLPSSVTVRRSAAPRPLPQGEGSGCRGSPAPQTFLSISFLPPRGKKAAPSDEGAKECA